MPDVYGFETPEEAILRQQEQLQAANTRTAQATGGSPGGRLGVALSQIFAPIIAKTLDTREARKERVESLLRQDPRMTKEEARLQAKLTVSREFQSVRKAKQKEAYAEAAGSFQDRLVKDGVDPQRAQISAMTFVANNLRDGGFINESNAIMKQAVEAQAAYEESELNKANIKSTMAKRESEREIAEEAHASDSIAYIKRPVGGKFDLDTLTNVPMDDPAANKALIDDDYIRVLPGMLGIGLGTESIAGAPAPIPRNAQETVIGQFSMLNSVAAFRAIEDQVGFDGVIPEGPLRGLAARMGIPIPDNEDFSAAVAIHRKMRADVQSLIDGIPSNYDAKIFEAMIPNPAAFRGKQFFTAQVDLLEATTKDAIAMTIGFYKGTKQPMPESVVQQALSAGIDVSGIRPWTADEVDRVDNIFNEHQEATRQKINALEEETQPLADALKQGAAKPPATSSSALSAEEQALYDSIVNGPGG